jgi:hypothetical protein
MLIRWLVVLDKQLPLLLNMSPRSHEIAAALAGHIRSHKQATRSDSQAALLEALSKQTAALEAIARELAAIRHLLAGLNIVEAKVEKRVISTIQPEPPPEKQPKTGNLPSFLQNNPWVSILSRRGQEP